MATHHEYLVQQYASVLLTRVALKALHPAIQFGEAGLNDDGFYLDFYAPAMTLSENDLPQLTKQIQQVARDIQTTATLTVYDQKTALAVVKADKYATALIHDSKADGFVFLTRLHQQFYVGTKNEVDLAAAAHIQAVHLFGVGGAYWQANKANEQLVRLTGCGFNDPKQAKAHLDTIAAQRARDHRKIGRDLDIFAFDLLAGQGMPLWLRNGATLRSIIGDYVHECERAHGYEQVNTPVLGSVQLYKTSGHFGHYAADMFPLLDVDGEQLMLRPMTCPHHCLIYLQKPRSYRDLPIRLCEDAILHRYEKSGALSGLERVRTMTLLDTHIFCRPDQIATEIFNAYQIIQEVCNTFHLHFERVDLSLRDPHDQQKYVEGEAMWLSSENQLASVLDRLQIKYNRQYGEAAFYGPKIDFQCRTALNKIVTVSTIQLDFSLPQKFQTTYKTADGTDASCVLIHLGIIGTYERFIALLLEQTGGVLPFWLAPVQAIIIPVDATAHAAAATTLHERLKAAGVRSSIDLRNERLRKKIRDSQIKKIPLQLVVGDHEIAQPDVINFRHYGATTSAVMKWTDFIARAQSANQHRTDWPARND